MVTAQLGGLKLRIASPCTVGWDTMTGDGKVRFCGSCQKHVYNLSAMTEAEALALIAEREGSVCTTFSRRADGTVLTADCPVGASRVRETARKLKQRVLGGVVAAAGLAVLLPTTGRLGGLRRAMEGLSHLAKGPDCEASVLGANPPAPPWDDSTVMGATFGERPINKPKHVNKKPPYVNEKPLHVNDSSVLSADQVAKVVGDVTKGFNSCVEEELRRNPNWNGGKVTVSITIKPSGIVSSAKIDKEAVENSDVGACIKKRATHMIFPKFEGDDQPVEFPLILTNGG